MVVMIGGVTVMAVVCAAVLAVTTFMTGGVAVMVAVVTVTVVGFGAIVVASVTIVVWSRPSGGQWLGTMFPGKSWSLAGSLRLVPQN